MYIYTTEWLQKQALVKLARKRRVYKRLSETGVKYHYENICKREHVRCVLFSVKFPLDPAQPTKRGILGKVARGYDPLGLVSPMTLGGKLLYRDGCNLRVAWDAHLPEEITHPWMRWESRLPERVTTPRALVRYRERIDGIELHAFGDASGKGVASAVYAVVTQPSGINQGPVAAKARLVKQGLTIPRLELISGHMAVNLIANVAKALEGFPVKQMHCWLDSSVALHWIRGAGEYKQFVGNRVRKIQEHGDVTWRHVGTLENPADLGSRSGSVENKELWWRGPEWLGNPERWPPDIVTSATRESQAEAKATRQIFAVAIAATDELNALLEKCSHWRTLRVCAWVARFARNSRSPKARRTMGPLLRRKSINKVSSG